MRVYIHYVIIRNVIARLLISSSLEGRVGKIEQILADHELRRNHPDLLYFEAGEKLGIEQARKIKEHFSLKPYSSKGRAVVLEDASVMTTDAQNALLKTLEEPPEEAILLLGATSDAELLPTVLSRVEIIILPTVIASPEGAKSALPAGRQSSSDINPTQIASSKTPRNDEIRKALEKLMNSSLEERFAYIEKLKEKEEFLRYMVSYFREKMLKNPDQKTQDFVKELLEAEKWASQNVNIRAILEYLMLIMPYL